MNKKIIILTSILVVSIAMILVNTEKPQKATKTEYKALPEKYELVKDPRYQACVDGANNVIQKDSKGNEKMIQITCKQIERMKINDLKNSCLMGAIGLLHFIDQKEFLKLKGQDAIDWADKKYCSKYQK